MKIRILKCLLKRWFLVSFTLFLFDGVFSQSNYVEGFIVNNELDTIHGYINFQDQVRTPQNIKFKNDLDSRPKKFTKNQLKAFYVKDQVYYSRKVSIDKSPHELSDLKHKEEYLSDPIIINDTLFIMVLVEGNVNLYFIKDENYKDHFYIESDSILDELIFRKYLKNINGKELIQENTRYKGQLSYYLRKCSKLQKEIENLEYEKKPMSLIINKYNNCFSSDTVFEAVPYTSEDKLQLDINLLAGATLTTLKFNTGEYLYEDLKDVDFGYSLKPSFGIALNIVFPKKLKRWSLYNELRYHSYKLQGEAEKTFSSFKNNYYYEFEYAYIKYSLMLRYRILFNKIQPFINVGIVNSWAVKSSDSVTITEYRYLSTNQTKKNVFDDPRKFEQGLLFGVGIYYGKFLGEFRFELANGMSNYSNINSTTNSYLFMLGFMF